MNLDKKWLAGFLDGEGSFGVSRKTVTRNGFTWELFQPFVVLSQSGEKNLWILEELKKAFGEGIYDYRRSNWSPKWKPAWKWQISNSRAVKFAEWIKDDLLVKKQQAEVLSKFPVGKAGIKRSEEIFNGQKETYKKLKILNQRGTATAEA